jgi:hypothetical protein
MSKYKNYDITSFKIMCFNKQSPKQKTSNGTISETEQILQLSYEFTINKTREYFDNYSIYESEHLYCCNAYSNDLQIVSRNGFTNAFLYGKITFFDLFKTRINN